MVFYARKKEILASANYHFNGISWCITCLGTGISNSTFYLYLILIGNGFGMIFHSIKTTIPSLHTLLSLSQKPK